MRVPTSLHTTLAGSEVAGRCYWLPACWVLYLHPGAITQPLAYPHWLQQEKMHAWVGLGLPRALGIWLVTVWGHDGIFPLGRTGPRSDLFIYLSLSTQEAEPGSLFGLV